MTDLTKKERAEIAEILERRSNEIAGFRHQYKEKDNHFGSVDLSLEREIRRLRNLAIRVNPPEPDPEED